MFTHLADSLTRRWIFCSSVAVADDAARSALHRSSSSLIDMESLADSFSQRLAGDQMFAFGFDRFDRTDKFNGSSSSISIYKFKMKKKKQMTGVGQEIRCSYTQYLCDSGTHTMLVKITTTNTTAYSKMELII